MTTYRVIKKTPLSTGQTYGELVDGSRFKENVLNALLDSGAISEVFMPPLSELPGWETRAPRLALLDVVKVQDLLEATPETFEAIKKEFRYKTNAPIVKWQEEALKWLIPATEKRKRR